MIVGAHLSIKDSVTGLIKQISSLQINTFQIFLSPPQNWKKSVFSENNINQFNNLKKFIKISAVHSPYIVNLASLENRLRNISIYKILQEIKLANILGIDYYIIHPGSPKNNNVNAGIKCLSDSLNKIILKIPHTNTKILIEWSAGEGFEIGKNLQEIKNIIELVDQKDKIGICLDTCHLFVSGIDISKYHSFIQFKKELEKNKLIEFVKLIHANDAKGHLGSKKDRHEHIGQGLIGKDGFKFFIKDDYFSTLPYIIETPKENNMDMDKKNITTLKSLFAQELL